MVRTSYCDIGFELAKDGKQLVLVSCLDDLLKGAAGQAVQNMNLMCGFWGGRRTAMKCVGRATSEKPELLTPSAMPTATVANAARQQRMWLL